MAGHSQFKNIMHRKGRVDARRARVFGRLSKEIIVAVNLGGSDTESNARLRLAIINARSENMPKDKIERAIERGEGRHGEGRKYEEIIYEGYGEGGTAILVGILSDNRNRTASEIRTIFSKNGGSLGVVGSVSYLFRRLGEIYYEGIEVEGREELLEWLLEEGSCEDYEEEGESLHIYCMVEELSGLVERISVKFGDGGKFGSGYRSQVTYKPLSTVYVGGSAAERLGKLLQSLEENEDTQWVVHNATDEVMST